MACGRNSLFCECGGRRQDQRGPSACGTLPRLPVRPPHRFRPRINFLSLRPFRHGPQFPEVSAACRCCSAQAMHRTVSAASCAESRRRKRCQIQFRLHSRHHLSHDVRCYRRQQNAIAKVSRRHEISRRVGRSQDWQIIRRTRPQTRPMTRARALAPAQEPEQPPLDACVESCQHRCACRSRLLRQWRRSALARHFSVPGTPRARAARESTPVRPPRQHLSFYRPGREVMCGDLSCPCSRAIHHYGCVVAGLVCAHASDSGIGKQQALHGTSGRDVHLAMLGSLQSCRRQRPRINTALFQIERRMLGISQGRLQLREPRRRNLSASRSLPARSAERNSRVP